MNWLPLGRPLALARRRRPVAGWASVRCAAFLCLLGFVCAFGSCARGSSSPASTALGQLCAALCAGPRSPLAHAPAHALASCCIGARPLRTGLVTLCAARALVCGEKCKSALLPQFATRSHRSNAEERAHTAHCTHCAHCAHSLAQ